VNAAALGRLFARARADVAGAAVIEFGLIAPILVMMYFGLVALSLGFDLDRKVRLAGRTAADLTARAKTMSCAEITANFSAASAMLMPNDPTGMTLAVANVAVTNIGTPTAPVARATVQWSQARRITDATGAQTVIAVPTGWAATNVINPIPSGFGVIGTTFVMATVTKNYVPPIATQFIGTTPLTHPFNWPARNATATTWSGPTAC
jgi:Flp pilus assembly protein TadG